MQALIEERLLPAKCAPAGGVSGRSIPVSQVSGHLLSYVDGTKLEAAEGRGQCRQRRCRPGHRRNRAPSAGEFIKINHEADGSFPNGVPNPMLEENRHSSSEAIVRNRADLGLAWDGDYDRCFFFDETRRFHRGLLPGGSAGRAFLRRNRGARIVHDPRLTWNTIDIVQHCGGMPVMCKSGHAFIKQRMREVDAVYGGEMSAHHYFRDFAYCDSGMIPWLLVLAIMSESGKSLSELVGERQRLFPASGEINRELSARDGRHHSAVLDARAAALPGARQGHRLHRRPVDGIRSLALQSARLEHRAAGAPECRVARRCRTDAGKNRRDAAAARWSAEHSRAAGARCWRGARCRRCNCVSPGHRSEQIDAGDRCGVARPRSWRPEAIGGCVLIRGAARERLSELFVRRMQQRDPPASRPARSTRRARMPLTAPLVIAVGARVLPQHKVPEIEQLFAVGCRASMNLLNAFHAQGFGAIWLTGANAYDPQIATALRIRSRRALPRLRLRRIDCMRRSAPAARAPGSEAAHVRDWSG